MKQVISFLVALSFLFSTFHGIQFVQAIGDEALEVLLDAEEQDLDDLTDLDQSLVDALAHPTVELMEEVFASAEEDLSALESYTEVIMIGEITSKIQIKKTLKTKCH